MKLLTNELVNNLTGDLMRIVTNIYAVTIVSYARELGLIIPGVSLADLNAAFPNQFDLINSNNFHDSLDKELSQRGLNPFIFSSSSMTLSQYSGDLE